MSSSLSKRSRLLTARLALAFSLIAISPSLMVSSANDPLQLPPGWQIPHYTPELKPYRTGQKLTYACSWIGIPAAVSTVWWHTDPAHPGMLIAEGTIRTNKVVDVVFKMRDYMREDCEENTLRAHTLYIKQQENKRTNEYLAEWVPSQHLLKTVKRNAEGSQERDFVADNPSFPMSASLMAASQPLALGKTLMFDVFSGRNRFVFKFTITKRERIRVKLGEFDAWRIDPEILYVSDPGLLKKAHDTVLWVSADQHHVPLLLSAKAFVGTVRAELWQVTNPSPPAPAPSPSAKH